MKIKIENYMERSTWAGSDFFEERMRSIRRTGKRLARLLNELKNLEQEIDRLEVACFIPGLSSAMQQDLLAEMDLLIEGYNHLREAATNLFRYLINQRESCGFRGHELIQRCFSIPEYRLRSDITDLFDQ